MTGVLLTAIGLALLITSVFLDKDFLLSPLFHFSLFFLLFIASQAESARSGLYAALAALGAASFLMGYWLAKHRVQARLSLGPVTPARLPGLSLTVVSAGYILGAAAQFLIQLRVAGITLDAFLLCPICETSLTGKENVAAGAFLYTAMISFLDILAVARLASKPTYSAALVIAVFRSLFYAGSLGTGRVMLVVSFMTPLLLVAVLRGDLARRGLQLTVLALGSISMLPLLYLLNIVRHGDLELDLDVADMIAVFSSDLNPGKNFDLLVRHVEQYGYDWGFFLVSPLIAAIPRGLFEGKPITSSQFYYTKEIFNADPIADITTYTFTMFDSFSAFGPASLCIVTLLYGFFFARVHSSIYSNRLPVMLFAVELCLLAINIYRTNVFDSAVYIALRYVCLFVSHRMVALCWVRR